MNDGCVWANCFHNLRERKSAHCWSRLCHKQFESFLWFLLKSIWNQGENACWCTLDFGEHLLEKAVVHGHPGPMESPNKTVHNLLASLGQVQSFFSSSFKKKKNPNYHIITCTAIVQSKRLLECHWETYHIQMLPMLTKASEAWAKWRDTIFPSFLLLFFTLFLITATKNNVPCLPHLLTKTCIPAC